MTVDYNTSPELTPVTLAPSTRAVLAIDETALQEDFMRYPQDLAEQNERYVHAHRAFLVGKLDRETMRARLVTEHRERLNSEAAMAKAKPPTVDAVTAAVDADGEWQDAKLREIELEIERIRQLGLLEAMRAKKDMLVSIGAHQRAEMQS